MRLCHPGEWEITRLERDQIQWSDGGRPALELRWTLHRGRYQAEKVGRRFSRRARRKGLPELVAWEVPPDWRSALPRHRVSGFTWRRSGRGGIGLLLYCGTCRRLTLLQIHPFLADQPDRVPALLMSLQDHPDGPDMPLSLFGIRARLPAGAKLIRYRFDAGCYQLLWRHRGLTIGLHRWAPAQVILASQSLADFTGRQFQIASAEATAMRQNHHPAVEAAIRPGARLPGLFRSLFTEQITRVWHIPSDNALLGVGVRGRGGSLNPVLDRIANTYETCPIPVAN